MIMPEHVDYERLTDPVTQPGITALRSSRRNILIIVQNLPVPFDRRVWQEANTLRLAGFGVAVICPKSKTYSKSYERQDGVDIYRYPLLIEADNSVVGYVLEFVCCWFATLWLAFRAYCKCPFHVIHACNPPDTYFGIALLFRPLGVKFVFDHHDLCPELYVAKGHAKSGLIYRTLLLLERMTFRTADMVIAANESYRQVAKTRGGVPGRCGAPILPARDQLLRAGLENVRRRFGAGQSGVPRISAHSGSLRDGAAVQAGTVRSGPRVAPVSRAYRDELRSGAGFPGD